MTISELSQQIGVPHWRIRRLIERGLLPAKRPPRGIWIIDQARLPEIKRTLEEYGLMQPMISAGTSKVMKAARTVRTINDS